MARVTIEDCMTKVDNRFELVTVAAQRAKAIASGSPLTVERDNDKDSVIALREIADGNVKVDDLKEELVRSMQKPSDSDEFDMDVIGNSGEEEAIEAAEDNAEESDETQETSEEETKEEENTDASNLSFSEDNIDVDD